MDLADFSGMSIIVTIRAMDTMDRCLNVELNNSTTSRGMKPEMGVEM
jgi:hypothetical protein